MNVKNINIPGDDRMPRYLRLAEVLKAEIIDKKWHPGDRIPSESELAKLYNVAHGTTRQAITHLVDQGLLERKHGAGTFVRKASFDSSLFRFFRFTGKGGQQRIPESRILKREIVPACTEVANALKIDEGTPVIAMSRLRLIDNEPVLAEEIFLDATRFKGFETKPESEIGPLLYPIYDTEYDQVIARATEELSVEIADAAYERILRVVPNTPVIVIERVALGYDDLPIEWRRSRGRADRFKYQVNIT